MKDLSIAEFGRQCVALIDDLPDQGLLITKDGEPVAVVSPVRPKAKGHLVTGPLVIGKGRPGPLCPTDEKLRMTSFLI